MDIRKFAYIRVSSKDQNENRQLEIMRQYIKDERDIFIDKQSGRDFNREQYQLLKRMLRKGDILYVHSLDRFGRNKEAILQEWKDITKNIQAHIIVLDMPLLDTTQYKDSLGNLITDLVLQILSWLAEEERTKIKTRQREGIEIAKKQGKHLGRPRTEITEEFIAAYTEWKKGEISALEAMRRCNMTSPTFYRVVKRYENRK
ncbi:recombinase family protein [Bacillus pseudomycoides]|jgi:DNA invertase Pin-like site-specific DNA recombinase|uniref:recombinase family protein n=1 Tax=Bacillus pseudomycoides TaxID=64104 RepID=UPI000BEE239F|nr:recombinase family protein [Bacillus pseudomycoides]PEY32113.1 DNA recombinase [Bacillus cereus]MBD5797383.1 DNA recombinase [Bacillus pseudomycoides]MED1478342.1 recombinase family protein [Bacillus pseudomycoides]PDY43899.1 DNA recombinase [Bacillus pseudomycoides]PEA80755.1 DNA recombinase [Bacillus pseudomycoides]